MNTATFQPQSQSGLSIAVIGGGVAGLTSAWLLSKRHRVSLFERDTRVGGHTHTVTIEDGPDEGTPVDTGFIVCNDRTYPHFHTLLDQLGCQVRPADMSFGYTDEVEGLAYSGAGLGGLFAQRSRLLDPRHWAFLANVIKFQRAGRRALAGGRDLSLPLGRFLAESGVSQAAVDHYVVPMGAAIWSATRAGILEFPASSFLHFFENHGLLTVTDMPQWQTVRGGSHAYVKSFLAKFKGGLRRGGGVRAARGGRGPGAGGRKRVAL
jgi:predicted NAD/FAD-binding protein